MRFAIVFFVVIIFSVHSSIGEQIPNNRKVTQNFYSPIKVATVEANKTIVDTNNTNTNALNKNGNASTTDNNPLKIYIDLPVNYNKEPNNSASQTSNKIERAATTVNIGNPIQNIVNPPVKKAVAPVYSKATTTVNIGNPIQNVVNPPVKKAAAPVYSRNVVRTLKIVNPTKNNVIPTKKDITTNSISKKYVSTTKSTSTLTKVGANVKSVTSTVPPIEIKQKVCPENPRIPLFSLPCESNKDCAILGPELVCCKSRCIQGVDPPKPEIKHDSLLFNTIDRKCPENPLIEFFDIKECKTDRDCAPTRICCEEKRSKASIGKAYCRNPEISLEKIPVAKQIFQPVQTLASFLQCGPPPPAVLDLFPKLCTNQLDCFPNLCCQEGNRKVCRPPKRSFLTVVAGISRRFIDSEWARKLIERVTT